MAVEVLTNAKLFFDGYDFSGDMNALAITYGADLLDNTTFGNTTHRRLGGLKTLQAQHEGFYEAQNVDKPIFDNLAIIDKPMTISPKGGAEGDLAYSFLSVLGGYQQGGQIGEVLPFSVSVDASGDLIRGTILAKVTSAASGQTTAQNLGSVSAAQKLYGILHVTNAAGTSLDVKIQSDDASGFPSALDRITFAQKTAIGSEWAIPVAGAISDTWWRIDYTIVGGSFTFNVVLGIQ